MVKSNASITDPSLADEVAAMRQQSRQHSVRNAISWVLLFVVPAILAGITFLLVFSEVWALAAAVVTNLLSRAMLRKLGWSEP